MPRKAKDLKRIARERAVTTGERYATARAAVLRRASSPADADAAAIGVIGPELGAAIAAARRRKEPSRAAAADQLGVSLLKLDLLERGATSCRPELADRLCSVLDLEPNVARRVRAVARLGEELERARTFDESVLPDLAGQRSVVITTSTHDGGTRRKPLDCFIVDGNRVVVAEDAGEAAAWVRDIVARPTVLIGGPTAPARAGHARVLRDGDERSRGLEAFRTRWPLDMEWIESCGLIEVRVRVEANQ